MQQPQDDPWDGPRFYENMPPVPILPAWATDAMVEDTVNTLIRDIAAHRALIDHNVRVLTPVMLGEAEALLTHAAEGW